MLTKKTESLYCTNNLILDFNIGAMSRRKESSVDLCNRGRELKCTLGHFECTQLTSLRSNRSSSTMESFIFSCVSPRNMASTFGVYIWGGG